MTPGDRAAVRNHMRILGQPSSLMTARQLFIKMDVYPERVTITIIMSHGVRAQAPVQRAQQLARGLANWVGMLSLPSQYGTGRWNACMPYMNRPLTARSSVLVVDMTPIRRRGPLVRWQVEGAGGRGFRYTEHQGNDGEDEDPTGGPLNSGVLP
jgi:hypothetical protein